MNPSPMVGTPPLSSNEPGPNGGQVFTILLALYALILYPILRANRTFNDDLKRALIGHTGWDSNGRPLTTLLMKLMQCYDSALVDISPLAQILAVAVLAWVGVQIARRYAIRSPWMAALVAFPLGAQPFFLENLSFKFDSLSMSLAVLLALLPVLTLGHHRRGWWLGVLSLFGALNFYQPAINAYLIFVLLDVVLAQLANAPVGLWLKQFFGRVLQGGLTMLLYQVIVASHIHGWVGRRTEKINSLAELPLIKKNITGFFQFINDSFNQQWWSYFLPLLCVLLFFPLVIGVHYGLKRRAEHPSWQCLALLVSSLLLPALALLSLGGPMLLLRIPEFTPRVMMGVGAVLVAGLITMQAALAQWHRSARWTLAAGCMLAMGMCSIASAYGNALGEQKAYEDRIAANLADDLAELRVSQGVREFLLDGTIGFSPITTHVADEFPIVNSLISPYIVAKDPFLTPNYLMYFVDGVTNLDRETDPVSVQLQARILARAASTPALRTSTAYTLRVIDKVAVVTLHAAPKPSRAAANLPVAHPSRFK